MEIKIRQTTEEMINIQIPSFWAHSCHTYKIVSDNRCIAICDLSGMESIGLQKPNIVFCNGTPNEISEGEFNSKFDNVLFRLRLK